MLESEMRCHYIKCITNAKTTKVEAGSCSRPQLDDKGNVLTEHEVPFKMAMMLPAFKGVDPVGAVPKLCNPRVVMGDHGDFMSQDRHRPAATADLPALQGRRPQAAGLAAADLRRRPFAQVPDLHPEHAAVPGQLPVGRGHPRLPEHRARHREAAGRHALAGIRLPPRHAGQPLPVGDGPGLPGTLRIGLQPQRGRGLRRHQFGRAFPGRIRHREQAGLRETGASARARRWR